MKELEVVNIDVINPEALKTPERKTAPPNVEPIDKDDIMKKLDDFLNGNQNPEPTPVIVEATEKLKPEPMSEFPVA